MKQRKWQVHAIAECRECGWGASAPHWTVVAQAKRHHVNTGHRVHGETGSAFEYGGDGK